MVYRKNTGLSEKKIKYFAQPCNDVVFPYISIDFNNFLVQS
jgi:hypothetical protein